MPLLNLQLNVAGLRALAIGDDPQGAAILESLREAGMVVDLVEDYRRQYLTPRPMLVVLMTRDGELAARVRRDVLERGILLIDVLGKEVGVGEGGERKEPPYPPEGE